MEIKYTTQGLLIYAVMAIYLLAFVVTLLGRKKAGRRIYLLGFVVAAISVGYRWYHVRHVPMQNLFEVFLCLGMLVYPLSVFCLRILGVGALSVDMLLEAIVLFPAGFVFNDQPQHLPPALQSWLFAPHVAVYMLSYILMAKAAVQAAANIAGVKPTPDANLPGPEEATYRMVCAGFPLLTVGLVLGSWWGQLAWGDWWGWDPKEMWSLASWLVFVGYLHFRYMFGKKYPRANSAWVIAGMVVIIVTLLWANLSRLFTGLHSYAV